LFLTGLIRVTALAWVEAESQKNPDRRAGQDDQGDRHGRAA
jgi:hypothetical protein